MYLAVTKKKKQDNIIFDYHFIIKFNRAKEEGGSAKVDKKLKNVNIISFVKLEKGGGTPII